ncbi:MAG: pyridoxamine 5'-phosphate oxidase family protein, partial [Rhodospirillales bacterium]|nr:pyridoxamine 5'-phosphate oxidase family protein [Rhodospirillales bacterium]
MGEEFTIASFRDVADGLQAGQFDVGDRKKASSLDDLDPIYKQLLDKQVVMVLAVIGADGRPGLTPMWFDYEDDHILVNTAEQRPKCKWIRKNPHLTLLLLNPENPYHWVSIKCTVAEEVLEEDDPSVTTQLDKIWTKYTGEEPPYALRDPSIDEK